MSALKDMIKSITKKKSIDRGTSNNGSAWFLNDSHNADSSSLSNFTSKKDLGMGKEFETQSSEINSTAQNSYSDLSPNFMDPSQSTAHNKSVQRYDNVRENLRREEHYNNLEEDSHKDPLDPFTPRSTENLPDQPNISQPPPLPVKKNEKKDLGSPISSQSFSTQGLDHKSNVEEDYGLLPNDSINNVQDDMVEEILNDLRFLRSQNDLILELLKRIERKLP